MASFKNAGAVLARLLWRDCAIYRYIRYKRHFPGLNISVHASMDIGGQFSYGTGTSVGDFARVIVFGSGVLQLGDKAYIGRHVELATDSTLMVGGDTSIQDFSVVVGNVQIGDHCLISYGIMLTSGRHNYDLRPEWLIRDQDELVSSGQIVHAKQDRAIVIEDDCWIGAHAVVSPGVRVGRGSVIGANSVVTADVPPYSVAVGAPARVVRRRLDFSPPTTLEPANNAHLPYLYSGFSVSQRALSRTRELRGVAASRRFILALAGGRSVSLQIRTLAAGEATLQFEGQTATIDEKSRVVSFDAPQCDDFRLRFDVSTATTEDEVVVLEKAWTT